MRKTFEVRIKNRKDKKYLKGFIIKYRHWQNILTIIVINLFNSNNPDYKCFLDYRVVRACISNTRGSKGKVETISYIKDKYKDNQLHKDLVEVGKELKTHNLVEIVKRLKKDFSNYFNELKDYNKKPDKYTGHPQLPKTKKLSLITNYSIPLDSYNSISFKKKNYVGINLSKRMRYFYIGRVDETNIFKNNIKSVQVKYQNNEIYLQFTYQYTNNQPTNKLYPKYAGLDIGLNNLVTLFVDDKETPSLIIDGAKYKYYNYRFNKLNSKLDEEIAKEVTEYKEVKETKYPVKWTERGYYLKRFKTYIAQKRNEYFKTNFHKLSKKIIEYLLQAKVTHLAISTTLANLKNNGECKLRKSVKQNFIQIPFIQLLKYIEEKAKDNGIEVIRINEAYTSKTSCITKNVCKVQTSKDTNALSSRRVVRGLLKDKTLNKVWNADVNGAVNHIKLAAKKDFNWLKDYLWKLTNPIKLKSAGELHSFLCNIRSKNFSLIENTPAHAYRYSASYL